MALFGIDPLILRHLASRALEENSSLKAKRRAKEINKLHNKVKGKNENSNPVI